MLDEDHAKIGACIVLVASIAFLLGLFIGVGQEKDKVEEEGMMVFYRMEEPSGVCNGPECAEIHP